MESVGWLVPLFGRSVGFCLLVWLIGWLSCWLFVLQGTLFSRFVRLFGWLLCCSVCRQSACIAIGRHFGSFLCPSGEDFKLCIPLSALSVLPYISAKWGKNVFYSYHGISKVLIKKYSKKFVITIPLRIPFICRPERISWSLLPASETRDNPETMEGHTVPSVLRQMTTSGSNKTKGR
jgi:hypothetical protein